MSHLTVWKFEDVDGAPAALAKLMELSTQNLIEIYDAATVTWPTDKNKPRTDQLNSTTAAGAVSGSFWGLLFGILFFMPLLGALVGAAAGALSGSMVDVGIDDTFIKKVQSEVTPGTSALFLMSGNEVIDRIAEEFEGTEATLLASNATRLDEEQIKAIFE